MKLEPSRAHIIYPTCIASASPCVCASSAPLADDPYLRSMLGCQCVHVQKVHGMQWVELIDVANKNAAIQFKA